MRESSLLPLIPSRRKQSGVALVIVLAFVVLMVSIAVAVFTRSALDRQVSDASSHQVKAGMLGRGAADTLLGGFKQQILDGSTEVKGSTLNPPATAGTSLYFPKTAKAMMPARSPDVIGKAGLENVIFASGYGANPLDTAALSATSVTTDSPSQDGRVVPLKRWNKPLLIQKNNSSGIDVTPVSTFAPPKWVLVARDGSNPTSLSQAKDSSASNNGYVVGRFAYVIYDQGGLLDINAAGYPSGGNNTQTRSLAYKNTLAGADLTKIGLNQADIDQIVGWRNYASAQPSGQFPNYSWSASSVDSYLANFFSNPTLSFLRPVNLDTFTAGQSDRMFTSRQQLIQFFTEGLAKGNPGDVSRMQAALPYLSTFTRDLNQPSINPAAGRPKVVSGTGGNSAAGNDDNINVSFLKTRVSSTVAKGRNDGTDLVAGEPLVKKRFSLNRLAWITYRGPITLDGKGYNPALDPKYVPALKTKYGFTDSFLLAGTPQNIYKYFGLSWVPDTRSKPKGDGQNKWVYNHANLAGPYSSLPGTGQRINRLTAVTDREPDFFELLKAAISVGSKAKTAMTTPPPGGANVDTLSYQFNENTDTSLELAIIQVGANIIDQYDLDGYPARILFNDGSLLPKEIRGSENVPYLYQVRYGMVQGRVPVASTAAPGTMQRPSLTNTGYNILFRQPAVWNPYDQNSPVADPSVSNLVPTTFRCAVYSIDPDSIDNSTDAVQPTYGAVLCNERMASATSGVYSGYASPDSADATTPVGLPFYGAYNSTTGLYTIGKTGGVYPGAFRMAPANTAIYFNVPNTAAGLGFFREPTLLNRPNVPAGSNVSATPINGLPSGTSMLDPNVSISNTVPSNHPNIKSFVDSSGAITNPLTNTKYLGFYMMTIPANWYVRASTVPPTSPAAGGTALAIRRDGSSYQSNNVLFIKHENSPTLAVTYRMQCLGPDGNWISYDDKYATLIPGNTSSAESSVLNWTNFGSQSTNLYDGLIGLTFTGAYDPRTSRFGMPYYKTTSASGAGSPNFPPFNASTWVNQGDNVFVSMRPDANNGYALTNNFSPAPSVTITPTAAGWKVPGSVLFPGLLSQNDSSLTNNYSDPDATVRRAMGAYAANASVVGLPMATATSATNTPTAQVQSRPVILNRPFRTVGELGYVFSGTPWKNLDFFTPESGDASLLDLFSVGDADDSRALMAGKVNLNTAQDKVLQAILAGAYQDEQLSYAATPAWKVDDVSTSLASSVAKSLVDWTSSSTPGQGPLRNVSEIVGFWDDSTNGFKGFSDKGLTAGLSGASLPAQRVQRLREASVRALAAAGQTRVWNLMIDIIAQTGRYPASTTDLAKFSVDGEQRLWVHVAIDRLTGEVLDKQIEIVKE